MTYINDCREKFNRLPDEIKSRLKSPVAVQTTAEIDEQYKIDSDFVITLVMIGELAIKDIPEYLSKKYGISRDNAANIKDELVNKIFKSILDDEELSALNPVNSIKEIFQYKILSTMQEDKAIIKEINDEIIFLIFTKDLLNQDELVQILSSNQELLTAKKFILDNRVAAPTIANWIKDFIKYHGVNFFDLVVLSRYLTGSANAKILDEEEKRKVIKLLRVYRNLKFFPLSMSDDVDEWETFPVEKEEVLAKAKTVSAPRIEAETARKFYPVVKEKQAPRIEAMISKKVYPTVKEKPAPPPSLAKAFYEYEKFQEQVLKKEDELMVKAQGNADRIKRDLANAALGGDKNTLVACLKILARAGSLQTVLQDHPAWFAAIAESMRKKYTTSYGQGVVEQMISNAKLNPDNPALLSEFLQYLLNERLKMNENDSALVGLEIGQMLYGENQRFSFGNEATGEFEWVKNRVVDGKLVSEI